MKKLIITSGIVLLINVIDWIINLAIKLGVIGLLILSILFLLQILGIFTIGIV